MMSQKVIYFDLSKNPLCVIYVAEKIRNFLNRDIPFRKRVDGGAHYSIRTRSNYFQFLISLMYAKGLRIAQTNFVITFSFLKIGGPRRRRRRSRLRLFLSLRHCRSSTRSRSI